jgi:hypothetical protein
MKICKEIEILSKAPISEINDLQGNLKDLSEKEYNALKTRIETKGFKYPFYVWIDKKGVKWTLDGHQRKRVIETVWGKDTLVPYIEVFAENKKEAKKEILAISSDYGKVTKDGWDEFAADFHEMDLKEIGEQTTFKEWFDADFEMPNFDEDKKPENKTLSECPKCGFKWEK